MSGDHQTGTLLEHHVRKSLFVLTTIVAASLFAAACGSSETTEPSASDVTLAAGAVSNDADVSFAQGMIPHHSQAVEMATMALKNSSNPAILDLATRIQGAQDPEIDQMRGWLDNWGQEEMATAMEGMDHSAEGMMSDADLTALDATTGAEFDAMFVDMMILHHQGAIAMAKTVMNDGTDPQVRALAEAIISAQEGEIAEMQGLDLG